MCLTWAMSTLTHMPTIESTAVILREITAKDSRQISDFMLMPLYQRHIAMRLPSLAAVEDFVARSVARQGDTRRRVFHLAAEERITGAVIGDGFMLIQHDGTAEIGWGVHPAYWSRGLGTEIGEMLLALSFEQLGAREVFCKVMKDNRASLKLARRIGMRFNSAQSAYPAGAGRFEAIEIYRMTIGEYFNRPY